ncbi:unnamed protein product [Ostreobium quekettii]|uniref:Uncharacterized protein n=1 Tax=Ostreobium quekettii TaxID=121088 RepID=A0A8S1JAJ1_9CHLO|nr:unnamed protein product [Ostreobium quekettii]
MPAREEGSEVGNGMPPLLGLADAADGHGAGASLWSRILCCGGPPAEPPVSGYEVLIHDCSQRFGTSTIRLSDPRLKSRFPIWVILALGLVFVCGILIVFFTVPRGMSIGRTSAFNVTTIYLNQTYSKYRLVVKLKIPILNYNYIDGYVSGNVTMRFYHVTAGTQHIKRHRIQSRSISGCRQTEITATVDASFVPYEYIARVLDNCLNFPYELVFFVSGAFEVGTSQGAASVTTQQTSDCSTNM